MISPVVLMPLKIVSAPFRQLLLNLLVPWLPSCSVALRQQVQHRVGGVVGQPQADPFDPTLQVLRPLPPVLRGQAERLGAGPGLPGSVGGVAGQGVAMIWA